MEKLCILCWAVEEAPQNQLQIHELGRTCSEERWWLYTMTVANTGQALIHRGVGWRKALRAALTEAPFNKGEGMPPRKRSELLSHSHNSQLAFDLD